MHLNPPAQATAPFYRHLAAVTGTRRETGAAAARALSLSVRCCVLGGNAVDAQSNSIAPVITREYDVKIRHADWLDHLPPQAGDILTIDGFGEMRCAAVATALDGWSLTCLTKGAPA